MAILLTLIVCFYIIAGCDAAGARTACELYTEKAAAREQILDLRLLVMLARMAILLILIVCLYLIAGCHAALAIECELYTGYISRSTNFSRTHTCISRKQDGHRSHPRCLPLPSSRARWYILLRINQVSIGAEEDAAAAIR